MKNLFNVFILFLLLVWPAVAFAQSCCMNDSDTVREIQFPLTEKETETVFYYFNDEWFALPDYDYVQTDSIQKMEVKDDQYGNRAVFLTVSAGYLALLKQKIRDSRIHINLDPRCEFPGGNGKFKYYCPLNFRGQ